MRTLAASALFQGVGVHSGATATVRVHAAPPGHGRVFLVEGQRIPARADHVVRVDRCTTLGLAGATVSTVEHLLAAAAGLGLTDLLIEVEGPEVPILDGSALPFAEGFLAAGLRDQGAVAPALTLERPVYAAAGDGVVVAVPADEPRFECSVYFPHPLVGLQQVSFRPAEGDFMLELAPARTFGFWDEVQALLSRGLALGGDVSNALVIGGPGDFSSPPRFPDEPARHKCLDLVGDLALVGAPVKARVLAVRAGHRLHVEVAKKILEEVSLGHPDRNRSQRGTPAAAPVPVPHAGPGPGA